MEKVTAKGTTYLFSDYPSEWELAPKTYWKWSGCQDVKGPNPSVFLDKCGGKYTY